jgi:hypothetical protein
MIHQQHLVRRALNGGCDAMPMARPKDQRLQDQHLERSRQQL